MYINHAAALLSTYRCTRKICQCSKFECQLTVWSTGPARTALHCVTHYFLSFTDPGFGPKDPRWVGAWWLGFVICGLCTLVLAPPMAFFPPKFKVKGSDGKMHKVSGEASGYKKEVDVKESLKGHTKRTTSLLQSFISCPISQFSCQF